MDFKYWYIILFVVLALLSVAWLTKVEYQHKTEDERYLKFVDLTDNDVKRDGLDTSPASSPKTYIYSITRGK